MPAHRFERIQIPGLRTRRFLDRLAPAEWDCLVQALRALREGRRVFREDPNLGSGSYTFDACGFTVWFTAPALGGVATITQVRYLPDIPE